MKKIKITCGNLDFSASLYPSKTADLIYENIPLSGIVNTWGEEIYFTIPVNTETETDAREILEPGELAFWPVGSAFCIFFGPTPVSTDQRPRAYSPVNVFGKIEGKLDNLKHIRQGEEMKLEILK